MFNIGSIIENNGTIYKILGIFGNEFGTYYNVKAIVELHSNMYFLDDRYSTYSYFGNLSVERPITFVCDEKEIPTLSIKDSFLYFPFLNDFNVTYDTYNNTL